MDVRRQTLLTVLLAQKLVLWAPAESWERGGKEVSSTAGTSSPSMNGLHDWGAGLCPELVQESWTTEPTSEGCSLAAHGDHCPLFGPHPATPGFPTASEAGVAMQIFVSKLQLPHL